MAKNDLIEELRLSIEEGDDERAREAAKACLEAGVSPMEAVEQGLREGLRIVGERFERLEAFLPEMMMASDAGNAVMEVLEPALVECGKQAEVTGTVVVGSAKGDIHSIGKNIVVMLLKLAGFTVHDVGENVAATTFVEEARKRKADIIAISALMTSTMPGQRDVINILRDIGERDRFAVIVGGAPTTNAWADEIGADGYRETAPGAVDLCRSLVGKNRSK